MTDNTGLEIAIIGMAGRFPEADNIETFWQNLREAKDCIRDLTDESLRDEGVSDDLLDNPSYVKRVGVMEGEDLFDAQFFDFNPREAEVIDPQQRIFLEVAWEALEHAGVVPDGASIGVWAGTGANYYATNNLMTRPDYLAKADPFQIKIGMDPDFIATRVCYKLNLQGPGMTLQTACSTSLVTVHEACQGLLAGACDVAIAGGVGIHVPQRVGAMHTEGGIVSRDGRCRAFDASSTGTIGGNGAGAVILKRLEDAVEDRDNIIAVIKATSINNDGSRKVGFTAPSIEGQSRVIRNAQMMGEVSPDTIGYVEAHGTGTKLGDPIEIAALTRAFREETDRTGYCAVGALKSAIGHLDTAAGIAGLIKTAMVVERAEIPAVLHFETPNPQLEIESTPFFINDRLRPWESEGSPRRAAVSSFGIGGTNAHAILEQAPERLQSDGGRDLQVLPISAKTKKALDAAGERLAQHLKDHPEQSLADVAFTLQTGRTAFGHRRILLADSHESAAEALESRDPSRVFSGRIVSDDLPVTFLFPGQGAQYAGMAQGLYESESVFKEAVDHCAEVLESLLGLDLRTVLFPAAGSVDDATAQLNETRITQPALFTVEYALAQLWKSWSVEPEAMIGHSIGEYVAATLAGVFELDDALNLVAARGRLMQEMPRGSMLSVPQSAAELEGRLTGRLSLAAENAPGLSTVSGPTEEIEAFAAQLEAEGVNVTRLHTSHAFHSSMMDPMLDDFTNLVAEVSRQAPTVPFVSNLTGDWITDEQAQDPRYWADHLRHAVRFADGAKLLTRGTRAYIEVGPGKTLATFIRKAVEGDAPVVEPSLRHPKDDADDNVLIAQSLGKLWLRGVEVDWPALHEGHGRFKVPLPSYPFQRQRYWVEPGEPGQMASMGAGTGAIEADGKLDDPESWFHVPVWRRQALPTESVDLAAEGPWLVLVNSLEDPFAQSLEDAGAEVIRALSAESFDSPDPSIFNLDPSSAEDFTRMLEELAAVGRRPQRVIHGWTATVPGSSASLDEIETWQDRAFFSILHLARAIEAVTPAPEAGDGEDAAEAPSIQLAVLTNELYNVSGIESIMPEKALIEGPLRVVPAELTKVRTVAVDVARKGNGGVSPRLARKVVEDLVAADDKPFEPSVAYRGSHRWCRDFEAQPLAPATDDVGLRPEGVYLITGGLGGIGLAIADRLSEGVSARLVLLGRSLFPARDRWTEYLEEHGQDDRVAGTIRRLQAMEERGSEVLVASADVADVEEMSGVLDLIQERFGALHGVIHSAGVAGGGLIQSKTVDEARRVFHAKVDGLRALWSALESADMTASLDFFASASSLSAVLGGVGQVDYVSANAYLDAWAQDRAGQDGPWTVSINWDTWSESGMAVATATGGGPTLMSSVGGHDHPMLDRTVVSSPERKVFATDFSSDSHWVIEEHRIEGVNLLPGTAYLELAAGAFETRPCLLENVGFMNPVFAPEEGSLEVRTFLVERSEGGYDFSIASESENDGGRFDEYTRGRISALDADQPANVDLDALVASFDGEGIAFDPTQVRHGPHWQVEGEMRKRGDAELLARFQLPEAFAGETEQFVLHPSLMDAATSFFAASGSVLYLPVGYEKLVVYGSLTPTVWSHVRRHEDTKEGDDKLLFDIDLLTADGEVLVAIEGFTLRKIEDTAMRLEEGRAAMSARKTTKPDPAAVAALQDGLLDCEGADAFARILADGTAAQVLVSTVSLRPRIESYRTMTLADMMAESAQMQLPTDRHPRPEISTEYLAPRSSQETAIAEIWADMLGLEEVGVFDDFFELGGHSLLGIQINARIKDQYGVELPPGIIFERPTVALLAEAVADNQGGGQKSILEELAAEKEAEQVAAMGFDSEPADGVDDMDLDDLSEGDLDAMLAEMMSTQETN